MSIIVDIEYALYRKIVCMDFSNYASSAEVDLKDEMQRRTTAINIESGIINSELPRCQNTDFTRWV